MGVVVVVGHCEEVVWVDRIFWTQSWRSIYTNYLSKIFYSRSSIASDVSFPVDNTARIGNTQEGAAQSRHELNKALNVYL